MCGEIEILPFYSFKEGWKTSCNRTLGTFLLCLQWRQDNEKFQCDKGKGECPIEFIIAGISNSTPQLGQALRFAWTARWNEIR